MRLNKISFFFMRKTRRSRRDQAVIPRPPPLSANVVVRHKFRFVSTTGASTNITDRNLNQMFGLVCTVANTTLKGLVNAVKLHRVQVWAPPASQGGSVTCSVLWASGSFAPDVEVSDTSNSVASPAYISTVPPAGSSASFWMGETASNTMFTLLAPSGSVIDVEATGVLADTQAALTSYTVAAGTLGALYYPPLDGVTDLYTPVSLGTTT